MPPSGVRRGGLHCTAAHQLWSGGGKRVLASGVVATAGHRLDCDLLLLGYLGSTVIVAGFCRDSAMLALLSHAHLVFGIVGSACEIFCLHALASCGSAAAAIAPAGEFSTRARARRGGARYGVEQPRRMHDMAGESGP